ncbi:hypothetical protein P9112_004239 [Eukaryota sp. TZLM1-RC]
MELLLDHQHILSITYSLGSVSTLLPLPSEKANKGKKNQKFCFIDGSTLKAVSFKKDMFTSSFEVTLPSTPTSLSLGGKSNSGVYGLFVTCGNSIIGFNKKGSEQFMFETSSTEPITFAFVEDDFIHTTTSNSYSLFKSCEEEAFLLCPDSITSFLPLVALKSSSPYSLCLACLADSSLRLICGDDVVSSYELEGTGNCMSLINTGQSNLIDSNFERSDHVDVAVGLSNGNLVILRVFDGEIEFLSEVVSKDSSKIVAINVNYLPFMDSQVQILTISRDSGLVELFANFSETNDSYEFYHSFSLLLEDKLVSLTSGKFLDGFNSLLGISVSGRIISLTASKDHQQITNVDKMVSNLQVEISDLNKKLKKLESASSDLSMISSNQSIFNAVLTPITSLSCFKLTFTSEFPVDKVLLSSLVPMSLFNYSQIGKGQVAVDRQFDSSTECNFSILSGGFGESNQKNLVTVVITPKVQNSRHFELLFRSIEGLGGDVEVVGIINTGNAKSKESEEQGSRVAQKIKISLKPLTLHQSVDSKSVMNSRFHSQITFTGQFSSSTAGRWISQLFMTDQVDTKSSVISTVSTFSGSPLKLEVYDNKITAFSDNISALSIIKEVLSIQATRAKVLIKPDVSVSIQSIEEFFKQFSTKHSSILEIAQKYSILKGLEEISLNENEIKNFFPSEFADILASAEEIERIYNEQPKILEIFKGILTDLFIDFWRLKGHDTRNNIQAYMASLSELNFDNLLTFFK